MNSSVPAPDHGGRSVLYVDDEPHNLELFSLQLGGDFPVHTATGGAEALRVLERVPVGVLLTDERMPGMSGVELLARVHDRWPEVVGVIVSAYCDAPRLLLAINRGHAYEYVVKPWQRADLHACVARGLAMAERRRELSAGAERCELRERDVDESWRSRPVVTRDGAFLATLALARKAARSDAAVLVTGETGTGKELVARLVHESSDRSRGPFIPVNCAALAEGVLETELFGHEKGAFTGAHKARRGRFELAQGGTLFMDEIGDISAKVQVSLLRVLQEKQIERVGSAAALAVDARIVSATHRNLARMVREGRFREDLYYRLNVVPIAIPPLRERPDDIGPLVRHFVRAHGGADAPSIGDDVVERLARYAWPGNVRELENLVHRAVVLADGPELTLDDFHFNVLDGDRAAENGASEEEDLSPREEVRQAEREDLRRLLVLHGGNVARAARALGVARTTLVSRAKKHRLIVDGR